MKKPIKTCKNPDCGDSINKYKSSKREYCCDYCRNHDGHKRRTIENQEFIDHKNGLAKNYSLLKMHKDADILKETLEKYIKLGFNSDYLPKKRMFRNGNDTFEGFKIKDIIFRFNLRDNTIIIINKQ